jgi:hypothetical protein
MIEHPVALPCSGSRSQVVAIDRGKLPTESTIVHQWMPRGRPIPNVCYQFLKHDRPVWTDNARRHAWAAGQFHAQVFSTVATISDTFMESADGAMRLAGDC